LPESELAEVEIAKDLLAVLHKQSGATIRSLLAVFRQIEDLARIAETKAIGMAEWSAAMDGSDSAAVFRQLKNENDKNPAVVSRAHGEVVARVA
jgi:hypothetical protein